MTRFTVSATGEAAMNLLREAGLMARVRDVMSMWLLGTTGPTDAMRTIERMIREEDART